MSLSTMNNEYFSLPERPLECETEEDCPDSTACLPEAIRACFANPHAKQAGRMQDIYAAEEALFSCVMAAAVLEDTSQKTTLALAGKFGSLPRPVMQSNNPLRLPENRDLLDSNAREAGTPAGHDLRDALPANDLSWDEDAWRRGMDQEGNPQWITLSPSREELDAERKAAGLTRNDKGDEAIPQMRPSRFSRRQREDEEAEEKKKQNKKNVLGMPQSNKIRPRPFRRTLRMVILVAVVGFVYHMLAKKGWVPTLWHF